jgi:hypothetical protein
VSQWSEKEAVEPVTFPTIITGWITDRKPGLSAQRSMRRFVQYLCESAWFDWQTVDPDDITRADMKGLKDWLVKKGKAPGYIKKCRAQLVTLWRYGIGEGDPPRIHWWGSSSVTRRGFTDDEARKILLAAREEADPLLRWAPWIMAANGACIGEIAGSVAWAVMKRNGVWSSICRTAEASGPPPGCRTSDLKNKGSNRCVPLPHWMIDEGFLIYWRARSKGGALFPDVTPSPDDGKRPNNAAKTLGEWISVLIESDTLGSAPTIPGVIGLRQCAAMLGSHATITGHRDGSSASGEYGEYPLGPLIEAVKKLPHPLAEDDLVEAAE